MLTSAVSLALNASNWLSMSSVDLTRLRLWRNVLVSSPSWPYGQFPLHFPFVCSYDRATTLWVWAEWEPWLTRHSKHTRRVALEHSVFRHIPMMRWFGWSLHSFLKLFWMLSVVSVCIYMVCASKDSVRILIAKLWNFSQKKERKINFNIISTDNQWNRHFSQGSTPLNWIVFLLWIPTRLNATSYRNKWFE